MDSLNTVKPVDLLKALSSHPDVIRRKESFKNAVEFAKTKNVKIQVTPQGWVVYKPSIIHNKTFLSMGLWTSFNEKLELMEDIFFKERFKNGEML